MAMWMSAGTVAKKSPWVSVAIRSEDLDKVVWDNEGQYTLREIIEMFGGRIYGE